MDFKEERLLILDINILLSKVRNRHRHHFFFFFFKAKRPVFFLNIKVIDSDTQHHSFFHFLKQNGMLKI